MTTPGGATDAVARRLAAAGCVASTEEASELVEAAADPDELEAMVRRREDGEPLPWITGRTLFCGRSIAVERGVFVPRPQTEALARRAADLLPVGGRAADLCTGTGAIATHLATVPGARVVAVDIDTRAVACARRNGVATVRGDIAGPLRPGIGRRGHGRGALRTDARARGCSRPTCSATSPGRPSTADPTGSPWCSA